MLKYLFASVGIIIIVGIGFLMFWNIPAPSKPVEHAVAADKISYD